MTRAVEGDRMLIRVGENGMDASRQMQFKDRLLGILFRSISLVSHVPRTATAIQCHDLASDHRSHLTE